MASSLRDFPPKHRWSAAGMWLTAASFLTVGCGGDEPLAPSCVGAECPPVGTGQTTGGLGTTTGSVGTTSGSTPATTAGPTTSTGSTGNAMPTPLTASDTGDGIPCEIREILTARCGTCHSDPAQFTAPMPLTTQPHFAAASPTVPSLTVAQSVSDRIHSTEPAKQMPPAGMTALTAEELAALDGWLETGAAYVEEECAAPAGSDAGVGGGETPGTGNALNLDMDCYDITAHASGSKEEGYPVGVARDEYVNFNFAPPWGSGTAYARKFVPIVDNANALHHWLFFKNSFVAEDGSIEGSSGTHPESELINGWAPGGPTIDFTAQGEDVGMALEGDVSYTLELHYNSDSASAVDASGLKLCVTEAPPEQKAALSWVGTDLIFGTSAVGTCDPASDEPIHIIGVSPHMHLNGTHMKGVIHRADGTDEILHDAPFDFDYQTYYEKDVWLMPGDTIETTCTYGAFSTFGQGTTQEMCYLFTTHTPAGALADSGGIGSGIHGSNACLGL